MKRIPVAKPIRWLCLSTVAILAVCGVLTSPVQAPRDHAMPEVSPTRPTFWDRTGPSLRARLPTLRSVQTIGNQTRYVIPLSGDEATQWLERSALKHPWLAERIASNRAGHLARGERVRGELFILRIVVKTLRSTAVTHNAMVTDLGSFFFAVAHAAGAPTIPDSCDPYLNIAFSTGAQDPSCTTDEEDFAYDTYDDGNPNDACWDEYDNVDTTSTPDGEELRYEETVNVVADSTTVNTDQSDPDFGDFDFSNISVDDQQVSTQQYPGAGWFSRFLKTNKTWHGLSCANQNAIGQQIRRDAKTNALRGAVIAAIMSDWTGPGVILTALSAGVVTYGATIIEEDISSILTCYTDIVGSSEPEPVEPVLGSARSVASQHKEQQR